MTPKTAHFSAISAHSASVLGEAQFFNSGSSYDLPPGLSVCDGNVTDFDPYVSGWKFVYTFYYTDDIKVQLIAKIQAGGAFPDLFARQKNITWSASARIGYTS